MDSTGLLHSVLVIDHRRIHQAHLAHGRIQGIQLSMIDLLEAEKR